MCRQRRILVLAGLLTLLAPALSARAQAVSCTGVAQWVATTLYPVGARVTFQGGLYQALVQQANVPPNFCPSCGWWQFVGTCGAGDTTAPSVPSGLSSPSKTSTSVSLSWNASTDNPGGSGIAGYDVLQSGAIVGSPTTTSFTVTGLAANTAFSFQVRARDNANNASAPSAPLSVTTASAGNCNMLPSVPTGLASTSKTSSSATLSWNASSAGANCTIQQYDIFQNGALVKSVTTTSATITGLAASTTFAFRVRAVNQFGASGQSGIVSVTTDPAGNASLRFCPYIDVSPGAASPIMQLASNGSGAKCYSLAFILGRGCSPSWFGTFELNTAEADAIGQRIQELRAAGGDVIISFGGAAAPELANSCTDVNQLRAAYLAVVNKYHPMAVDFDIEDFDPNAIDRRNAAIAAGLGVPIHYTLGVLASGMTSAQISVLQNARSHNVNVSMVNIMAMDYGGAVADMFGAAQSAGNATKSQLTSVGYGSAQLGITVMIGQNDSPGEIFTLANAQSLRNANLGASMLSFWSIGRDNGGCPGQGAASASCSGVSQSAFQFSSILRTF